MARTRFFHELSPGVAMPAYRSSSQPPVRSADLMRTALVAACGVPLTLACGLRAIQLAACGAGGAKRHAVARAWARSILWTSRVRVSVSGADRIAPGRPYILMANHQGNYDIPILLAHLPVEFRWLAKAELFRIPVFGGAMRAIGCIAIDRADRESAFQELPGETQEDFEGTVELVQKARYKNCYVFKYSPRPGTTAERRLADTVPDNVKQQRNVELLAVQDRIAPS